jgi:predicted dienelactone hydrolase
MNSGIRHLKIRDSEGAAVFPAIVQYPTEKASDGTTIGPYHFSATLDAPIAEGQFPVCAISHGGGGSHLLYRSIATYLAANGFIVISLEHPHDNRNDRSETNTDLAAVNRPWHVSLALDAVLTDSFFSAAADASRICAIGHSMGGYTALVLAGAQAWSRSGKSISTRVDPRIQGAVLLAPATDWFLAPTSLDNVRIPLLVIAAELDHVTPPSQIQQVLTRVPKSTSVTFEVVPSAGHYSFLTPFPAKMCRADFPPSMDPQGFDRENFHRELPRKIHEFLARLFPWRKA